VAVRAAAPLFESSKWRIEILGHGLNSDEPGINGVEASAFIPCLIRGETLGGLVMLWLRCLLVVLVASSVAAADDWPAWLGPRRDGSTTEKVIPWKDGLKILWKQPVGEGHSSPVVVGDRVYLHARVKDSTQEAVGAYSIKDGTPAWMKTYDRGNFKSLFGNGPRATPTVAAGKVYTFGITGLLTCFAADSGEQLWQADALKETKAANLFFGASCSPLVEGKLVLVNAGGKGASLVAYDKDNGKIVWHVLDDKASYASPIAIGSGDKRQVIFLTAKGLVSVAPKDGRVFWQHPLVDKLFESSTTPVVIGDVLFGSSITYGGLGLKMADGPDGPKVSQVWMKPEMNCYFSTPVAVGKDHLYIVTGTKPSLGALLPGAKKQPTQANLHCVDAQTGAILWTRPKVGTYHASLVRTGDDKLLLIEEAGNLVLVDPNPKEYRELARAKICGNTWAHPAIANGSLYISDNNELVCVRLAE
jgi:outer membrane protein assembly factor BamB